MSTQGNSAEPVVVETPAAVEPTGATPEAEPLGPSGLAALKSEREAKAAAEKRAAAAEARIKEFEDAQKTEAEKQAEALAEAQAQLVALTVAKTRAEVAATKGVPTELVAGPASNSPEDIAAFADQLIKYKGEPQASRLHIPSEGNSPNSGKGDGELRDFAKQLFGSAD